VIQAAIDATGADRGWLLRADGGHFVVAAAYGDSDAPQRIGLRREQEGIAGFVLGSGQPAAIQTSPGDTDNEGAGGSAGAPRSVLAAPCGASTGTVLGVLEIVDAPGGSFSFDDVETIGLLADIGGAAMSEVEDVDPPISPEHLAHALVALAAENPSRYAAVARTVEALL